MLSVLSFLPVLHPQGAPLRTAGNSGSMQIQITKLGHPAEQGHFGQALNLVGWDQA